MGFRDMKRRLRRLLPLSGLTAALAAAPAPTAADDVQQVQAWRGTGFAGIAHTYEAICLPDGRYRLPAGPYPIAPADAVILRCEAKPGTGFDRLALLVVGGVIEAVEVTGAPDGATGAGNGASTGTAKWMDYAGYRLQPEKAAVFNEARGRTMFLSPEALHSHVFLNSLTDWRPAPDRSGTGWLDRLHIGASLEVFRRNAASACAHHDWRPQDPEKWGWPYRTMTQLDCFGPDILGARRKVELVFADGKLKYAWVLLARQELDRIARALEAEFGERVPLTADLDRIGDSAFYLRKDTPELLFADRDTARQIAGQ